MRSVLFSCMQVKSPFPHSSDFVCEIVVPNSHANVMQFVNVGMWTGSNEFACEMRHPKVSGNGPYF